MLRVIKTTVVHSLSRLTHADFFHYCNAFVNLTLPSKWVFSSNSLKSFGFLIDKDYFKPDPDRLSPLLAVKAS